MMTRSREVVKAAKWVYVKETAWQRVVPVKVQRVRLCPREFQVIAFNQATRFPAQSHPHNAAITDLIA